MSELRETVSLPMPAGDAERCILQYFERDRGADGEIVLPLRLMMLERPVHVRIAKARDAQNLNEEIVIGWKPPAGEPFPAFSGYLSAWSDTPETCLVELRGNYEPPLGAAGQFFDDALGHLIAQRTAREFLRALAQGAQECFHR